VSRGIGDVYKRRMEGRVALVAASSKGLGKACAMGLAREGAKVALCARNDDELQKAAQEIKLATGAEVFAQTADMTRPDDIEGLIGATRGHFGRIDILVTNAGGPPPGQFMDFADDDWLAALNLNLLSTSRMIRGVMPQMQAQQWGRIVNMTSVGARTGGMHRVTVYAASKAAIISMTKGFARHYAPDGILVNAVAPGAVDTRLIRMLPPEDQQATVDVIPLKRLAAPVEIARAVLFLASDANTYITGATTDVNGGSFMPD